MNEMSAVAEVDIRKRRLSWIWLIPLASLVIGGWLLWSTLSRRGPMIHVSFKTASGLKAGQTEVRYKDVPLGTVESFDLAPDRSQVVVNIRMTRKAEPFLKTDTLLWIVKPRLLAGDITGLNTIISGPYLELSPGEESQADRREFAGLETPPALAAGAAGRLFHINSARIGGLSAGSPVFYREIEVGKVVDWQLTGMADSVSLNVFIDAPYDRWVHDDSRFWNTSGVTLKLGAAGVQLQVNSLKAALLGGLAFETPTGDAPPSAAAHAFPLWATEETANAMSAPDRFALATYLTGPVGNLSPGAPVMLIGMPVGEVTAVELQVDTNTGTPRVRVAFVVQPDRVVPVGTAAALKFPAGFRTLVENGLRTSLKGGNLITGQKQLSLEIEADAPKAEASQEGDVFVIPSSSAPGAGFDDLSAAASQLLAKLGAMPFEQIGKNLNGSLQGVSGIVNGKPLKDALTHLGTTLASTQDLVRHLDAGAAPTLRRLPAVAAELQDTLAQVKALSASVSAGAAGNTRFGRDLDLVLNQVADAAVSVRMVADLLARHPEALIRGRTGRATE